MKINRICTVVTLLALLLLSASLVYSFNLWNIRGVKPSEVYRRYADTPGVNAAYIKDYQVNDSVTVSVTLLEAIDSVSWEHIKNDFNVNYPAEMHKILNGNLPKKTIKLAPKKDYNLTMDTVFLNNDLIVTTHNNHMICVFHLESEEQYNAIRNKQFDEIKPKY